MRKPLVIVGGSARAAAQSADRAGFSPLAVDLFGDDDLRRLCLTFRIDDYPHGAAHIVDSLPAGPWLYTGAWENHPELVDRIAAKRELLGNRGSVLRQVRDPFLLAEALSKAGLRCPLAARNEAEVAALCNASDRQMTWLRKPLRSAGGANISVFQQPESAALDHAPDSADWYLQQKIEGACTSGVFVGSGRGAYFLGATEQLVGLPWTGAGPFGYAGSIGPLALSIDQQSQFAAIGDCLAERFGLRGLFGVDTILNNQGLWPIEVNPRYTASIEVLERSLGIDAIGLNCAACRGEPSNVQPDSSRAIAQSICGKAVLYASTTLEVPATFADEMQSANANRLWPVFADIPSAGSRIEEGWPICTVFAGGTDRNEVVQELQTFARRMQMQLLQATIGQ